MSNLIHMSSHHLDGVGIAIEAMGVGNGVDCLEKMSGPEAAVFALVGSHGSSRLQVGGARFDKLFQRHGAAREIADGKHELGRHAVVGHLSDPPRRNAEVIGERLGSAALLIQPGFEFHDHSLDQSKRKGQGFPKSPMFMLPSTMDDLTLHRKRRLQDLINGKPFFGSQAAFADKVGKSKGRISQLLDPKEAFGERAGMALADALGMKDDRYFERPGASEDAAPIEPSTGSDALLEALARVTSAIQASDKFTQASVGPLFSMLSDPSEDAKTIAQRVYMLLTQTSGPVHLGDDPRRGKRIRISLGALPENEQRTSVQEKKSGGSAAKR